MQTFTEHLLEERGTLLLQSQCLTFGLSNLQTCCATAHGWTTGCGRCPAARRRRPSLPRSRRSAGHVRLRVSLLMQCCCGSVQLSQCGSAREFVHQSYCRVNTLRRPASGSMTLANVACSLRLQVCGARWHPGCCQGMQVVHFIVTFLSQAFYTSLYAQQ